MNKIVIASIITGVAIVGLFFYLRTTMIEENS